MDHKGHGTRGKGKSQYIVIRLFDCFCYGLSLSFLFLFSEMEKQKSALESEVAAAKEKEESERRRAEQSFLESQQVVQRELASLARERDELLSAQSNLSASVAAAGRRASDADRERWNRERDTLQQQREELGTKRIGIEYHRAISRETCIRMLRYETRMYWFV